MKAYKILIAGMLAIGSSCLSASSLVLPYIEFRSQSLDTPRHLVGVIQELYTAKQTDHVHGAISATLFYNRSFDTNVITQALFGIDQCETIKISGSHVAHRADTDWLADYFYLPSDFKSSLSFSPRIDNIGAELSLFVALDEWTPGLYIAVYAPLVHSRWNLNMCEAVEMQGTNTFAPGYFTPATLSRTDLLENFTEYAAGISTGPVVQTVGSTEFTTVFGNLRNARITSGELNQTRIADMRLYIGYDFIRKSRLFIGIEGVAALPVGNRPDGEYLFDAVVGNGHHWELGASLIGNGILWLSDDEEKQIILTLDATLTHLFAARQKRTLDLAGKPFSRYMLMERLGTPIFDNLTGEGTTPSAQFQQEFQPVANLSKVAIDVSAAIQAEITALVTLVCDNFSWDIGYNFWMRSCEHATLRGPNPFNNNSTWALKGDASVYGFDRGATGDGPLVGAVALSATQDDATIYSGLNIPDHTTAQAALNPAIDNPKNAAGDALAGTADNPLSADPNSNALTIQTSVNPIFITSDAINVCTTPTSRGMTNKIFTHFSYAWHEREGWVPYLGIGCEVEFARKTVGCIESCDDCIPCALSQWGLWLKGGLIF